MGLFTKVSKDSRTSVVAGSLNNTNITTTSTITNQDGFAFRLNQYVTAWDSGTYATPNLDPNARIGIVTALTPTSLTVEWGHYGTPITAIANTPVIAGLFSTGDIGSSSVLDDLGNVAKGAPSRLVPITTAKTLAEGDSGVVQNITVDGLTITLPATVVGTTYLIRNGSTAQGAVGITLATTGTDKVMGNGFTSAASKGAVSTKATARPGDQLVVVGGTGGWFIQEVIGTWVRQP